MKKTFSLILACLMANALVAQTTILPKTTVLPKTTILAAASGSTPTYVNSWVGANNQCTTATCSLTIAPVAGHTLRVLGLYRSDLGTITSLKDSASNSLTSIYNVTNINAHYGQFDYCESSIPSGLTAITLITSASADAEFLVYEIANAACTADGVSSNSSVVSGSSPVTSPSITPTAADKVAIAASLLNPGNAAITCTVGTGYTNFFQTGTSNNDGAQVCAELQLVTSASGSAYPINIGYSPTTSGVNANLAATK